MFILLVEHGLVNKGDCINCETCYFCFDLAFVCSSLRCACRLSLCLSPFLTGRMFVRPNILRTLRRTTIRFLTELLVRRIWFGQSRLYFILIWLVMRCKLRPELAADAQQTA